jgi:hypothetical protein
MSPQQGNMWLIVLLAVAVIILGAHVMQSKFECIADPVPKAFVGKPCGADVTWRYGYWSMRDETGPKPTVRYALGLWCGDHAQPPRGDRP